MAPVDFDFKVLEEVKAIYRGEYLDEIDILLD
jgi:hypothetical protein